MERGNEQSRKQLITTFIDLYCTYAEEFTDAPVASHHRVALSIISTIINRKVWLWAGDRKLYPNLWQLIIAPSSFYRKTTAVTIAQRILIEFDETLILPDDFSRERLIDSLAENPVRILTVREFKSFAGLLERDYMAGTQAIITDLFDAPPVFCRETKGKKPDDKPIKKMIYDPFLNILGASTMDWFEDSIKNSDIEGGFLPRFLIVFPGPKQRSIAWQKKHDDAKRNQLMEILKQLNTIEGEIIITEPAKKLYENWYYKFEEIYANSKEFSGFYARLTDYCKKFSILFAINRTLNKTIEEEDMRIACLLTDTYTHDFRQCIGKLSLDAYQRKRKQVLNAIPIHPLTISREKLYMDIRMRGRDLEEIISDLKNGKIVRENTEEFVGENKQIYSRKIYSKNE